ncbi:MAG: hypothetical protein R3C97_10220 [Geminicoccaceae bacterium]
MGQTGHNGRRWFQRGVRPSGIRDQRHEAVYLFGAACPERDTANGLVLRVVSTAATQAFLDELAMHIADDAHAVVIMDRAGIRRATRASFSNRARRRSSSEGMSVRKGMAAGIGVSSLSPKANTPTPNFTNRASQYFAGLVLRIFDCFKGVIPGVHTEEGTDA